MEHKLAKKLKDAGFPQIKAEKIFDNEGKLYTMEVYVASQESLNPTFKIKHHCDSPTLSELIEACGDKFRELFRWENGEWEAKSNFMVAPNTPLVVKGKTPEKAVANLYLELNK